MPLLEACLGGAAGAGAIEMSELYGAIRSTKDFPWRRAGEVPLRPYLFSVVLRLILGIVAAAICASAGPLGILGAVAAGIAAPKVLEEIGRHAPVAGPLSQAAPHEAAHPAAGRMPQSVSSAAPHEIPAASAEGGPVNASQ
jgi:hypothetical protein